MVSQRSQVGLPSCPLRALRPFSSCGTEDLRSVGPAPSTLSDESAGVAEGQAAPVRGLARASGSPNSLQGSRLHLSGFDLRWGAGLSSGGVLGNGKGAWQVLSATSVRATEAATPPGAQERFSLSCRACGTRPSGTCRVLCLIHKSSWRLA